MKITCYSENHIMSDIPTVWKIEPHTIAKHEILEEYLKAWFPILGSAYERIVYIDGFAGPGTYAGGEEGSPIIALRTAIEHPMIKITTDVTFLFIEQNAERVKILDDVLKKMRTDLPKNISYNVHKSEFADSVNSILNWIDEKNAKLAPTFAFVDPFGYSDFPMEVISRLLSHDRVELLITFMSGFVNRFLDPSHEKAVDSLYGTETWRDARSIENTNDRLKFLLTLYEKQLKEQAGAKFVKSFQMVGKDNQVVYDLVFCTKHWKGLEVMKKAMLKVDKRGLYKFSDRLGLGQTFFHDIHNGDNWMPEAAEQIFQKFRGKKILENLVHQYVITETNHIYKKEILKKLETQQPPKILSVTNRKNKSLSYPDGCVIEFAP